MKQHDEGYDPALGSLPPPPPEQAEKPAFDMSSPIGQIAPTDYELAGLTPPPTPIPDLNSAPPRPPSAPGTCNVCGSTPTDSFSFRQVTGMIFRWQMRTFDGEWCGPCAQSIGRSAQNKSMALGWLGLISALVNLAMVPANALQLMKAAQLTANPNPNTLDPGRPVVLRVGMLATAAITGLTAIALIGAALNTTKAVDDLAVGDCITDPGVATELSTIETISCDEPHLAEAYFNGTITGFDAFPGVAAVQEYAQAACWAEFSDYVGVDYEDSALFFSSFHPIQEGWQMGDRGFTCLVHADRGDLTGSVKGSGR